MTKKEWLESLKPQTNLEWIKELFLILIFSAGSLVLLWFGLSGL